MPSLSTPFYATPDELLQLVSCIIDDFHVHAVSIRYRPFAAIEVHKHDLGLYFSDSSTFRRWALTLGPPNLPVEHELDHGTKNPDHLRLDVGEFNGKMLFESWLSCKTDNLVVFKVWKKAVNQLKKMTKAGVTITSRKTGTSGHYKNFRYSDGAKLLEDQGVAMIPLVGPNGPIVRLGLL